MNKMSLTFVSFTKGILHRSGISRHDAGVFLASTCGTLLSSQGSDAHLTVPSRVWFWGNRSNLLPVTFPVNSPHRRVSRSEGVSIVHLLARNREPNSMRWRVATSWSSRGLFSPCALSPSAATRKTLRAGYARVKSLGSRACRTHSSW